MERRLFDREPVSMNGDLTWTTKGHFGRRTKQHCFVRTTNLSLDGVRVDMAGNLPFTEGAILSLTLGIHRCDVQIKDVSHNRGRTLLRLSFLSPDPAFVRVLENELPIITKNREDYEGKWI